MNLPPGAAWSKVGIALVLALVSAGPTSTPTSRPAREGGHRFRVSFTLADGNEKWPSDKRKAIVEAMTPAVSLYNDVGEFDKRVTVAYSPDTPTADANFNGSLRFGGQIGRRTALHELGHCMGIGTAPRWRELMVDGQWTGPNAIAQLKAFDGPDAVLKGDRQHFWPYGLNYEKESSPETDRRHVMMVMAFRRDMGITNGKGP